MTIPAPSATPRKKTARQRWRLTIVGGLVAAIASYGVVTALHADAAETLLSQGQPATASSTENVGTPASAAVDGNTGTRWSSAFSDPQWLQVDLGTSSTITRVALQWETARAATFTIQVSANGTSWTDATPVTNGADGTQSITLTATGRYVRMNGLTRSTQYGYLPHCPSIPAKAKGPEVPVEASALCTRSVAASSSSVLAEPTRLLLTCCSARRMRRCCRLSSRPRRR